MAVLNDLKHALRQAARTTSYSSLSDTQYKAGLEVLIEGSETTYRDFITPQLTQLLDTHFKSRTDISVLEIGPGPQSVLARLSRDLRGKFQSYDALEPNGLFASNLEEQLNSATHTESAFRCLAHPANICRHPLALKDSKEISLDNDAFDASKRYDLILFCHSMYGMKQKHKFIERALGMLATGPQGGIIVVFHRDGGLCFSDLVSDQTASYPFGVIRLADDDLVLDSFAPFIAGYALGNTDEDHDVRKAWRTICRNSGHHEGNYLSFSSPEVMVVFTPHATAVQDLMAQMPVLKSHRAIKNRKAHLQSPAYIARPTEIGQVQVCVEWALKYSLKLAVIGGGHSGHCVLSAVVSIDMSAIGQIHILRTENDSQEGGEGCNGTPVPFFVVVEAGSTVGNIIRKTMAAGLTVPLGARPSLGAGLWLQGGIGHLARIYGLSCDAIVGAVIISVQSGQILYVGNVPSQHRPAGSIRPSNEDDLLWAVKGAGTNIGIVISVTFRAYAATSFVVEKKTIALCNNLEGRHQLGDFDTRIARRLNRECAADAYLYWDADQLHLGVTTFQSCSPGEDMSREDVKAVDGIELFEAEMYMTDMHGGHGGGKTSAFKRCIFLKDIGETTVAARLVAAMESRPSNLCYLHLLQGGGKIGDVESEDTAFGCRDWDFGCVITGVWPRDQDGTPIARLAEQWVYNVAADLLPLSCGAYGADLGPDPRDAALAARAFGPNLARLARLKARFDPYNVLSYACPLPPTLPLPPAPVPKLIVLVTGQHGVGKDYSANVWAPVLSEYFPTRIVSISDATKREYAAATGADLHRLLEDRTYKEQHRPALTRFFRDQVQQRPGLPQEHFLDVVRNAGGAEVLMITGMRDAAAVAALSHLVPESRLIEVQVRAAEQRQREWRGFANVDLHGGDKSGHNGSSSGLQAMEHCPTLVFDNDNTGGEAAKVFAQQYLIPFLGHDLKRLADMVRVVHDFPNSGIKFRHVLGISEHPDGLSLCTSLLQKHFRSDWTKVGAIVSCEAGGFIYASPLAMQMRVPLILIRQAGKLPPPTISNIATTSYISSMATNGSSKKDIEIGRDVIPKRVPVLVVDDVLSTGKTLCAVLQLLKKAGVSTGDISIMVVAEFPIHRGRELLLQHGFGRVSVQSLLVLTGA
ncbi:phosphoribosyl transferase domain protein [Phaeosphaeria sp. MPI-PUGE-AT-0046c]|nr:phosphoribosyl transferase domain protein [Phaeosphaeria sp. MPI-PUGE-AT-0046c]